MLYFITKRSRGQVESLSSSRHRYLCNYSFALFSDKHMHFLLQFTFRTHGVEFDPCLLFLYSDIQSNQLEFVFYMKTDVSPLLE